MTQLTDQSLNNPITEDDIANYLANTPDFFLRHSELLAAVQLTSPHSNRAVSLQERQDMIRHGNDNVLLSDKILRWARGLLLVPQAQTLPALIAQDIKDQFSVPQVSVRLWGLSSDYADAPFVQGVTDEAKLFASSLTEPFCGLNTGFEVAAWLDKPEAASSVALIPLRSGEAGSTAPAFGMLVLASMDAQRFHGGMGTDFLARIGEVASAALSRLR